MKPAAGSLQQDGVLVTKSKDIGRVFGKSRFGSMQSKNHLHLDFIEACFLVEENKLIVYNEGERICWEDLISVAAVNQQTFETNYLIYRDLRRRGHQLKLLKDHELFTFFTKNQQEPDQPAAFIACFSERELCTINLLSTLLNHTNQEKSLCWLAIADEEGDITYYDLNSHPLTGIQKPMSFNKSTGILLRDRVLIFNESIAQTLYEKEFFGKTFGKGLQISLVEALYLVKNNFLSIHTSKERKISEKKLETIIEHHQNDINQRFIVYCDLKKRGLIVKTGFKFGNHFRAYTKHPDNTHAEYLIHAVSSSYSLGWAEVSRAIRLAHSVNKIFLFASIYKEKNVSYLAFKRIRP
ncbi:MAG TPA: tRNA-intron lyase [Candidatus Thermoplasmatota archaeon]|nr:tRNA-intron lyase [Candidatus Thermoplasmatota archaeon]